MAGVYICMIGGTAAFLTMPKLFGHAIDQVAEIVSGGSYSGTAVLVLVASILGVASVQGLFGFDQTYPAEALGEATVYDIRNTFFDKVQHLSFGFHDEQHTGNLISCAITDVESTRVFVNVGLVLSPYLLGLFVVVAVLLVHLDWWLGLLTASFMSVVGLLSVFVRVRLGRIWLSVIEHMSSLSTVLQEILTIPVWNMAALATGVARAIPTGRRLFEVIDTESPVREKPRAIEMVRVKGHVRYEPVSFAYDRDRLVLTDFNLDAEPGKVVALAGAPGSGKTPP